MPFSLCFSFLLSDALPGAMLLLLAAAAISSYAVQRLEFRWAPCWVSPCRQLLSTLRLFAWAIGSRVSRGTIDFRLRRDACRACFSMAFRRCCRRSAQLPDAMTPAHCRCLAILLHFARPLFALRLHADTAATRLSPLFELLSHYFSHAHACSFPSCRCRRYRLVIRRRHLRSIQICLFDADEHCRWIFFTAFAIFLLFYCAYASQLTRWFFATTTPLMFSAVSCRARICEVSSAQTSDCRCHATLRMIRYLFAMPPRLFLCWAPMLLLRRDATMPTPLPPFSFFDTLKPTYFRDGAIFADIYYCWYADIDCIAAGCHDAIIYATLLATPLLAFATPPPRFRFRVFITPRLFSFIIADISADAGFRPAALSQPAIGCCCRQLFRQLARQRDEARYAQRAGQAPGAARWGALLAARVMAVLPAAGGAALCWRALTTLMAEELLLSLFFIFDITLLRFRCRSIFFIIDERCRHYFRHYWFSMLIADIDAYYGWWLTFHAAAGCCLSMPPGCRHFRHADYFIATLYFQRLAALLLLVIFIEARFIITLSLVFAERYAAGWLLPRLWCHCQAGFSPGWYFSQTWFSFSSFSLIIFRYYFRQSLIFFNISAADFHARKLISYLFFAATLIFRCHFAISLPRFASARCRFSDCHYLRRFQRFTPAEAATGYGFRQAAFTASFQPFRHSRLADYADYASIFIIFVPLTLPLILRHYASYCFSPFIAASHYYLFRRAFDWHSEPPGWARQRYATDIELSHCHAISDSYSCCRHASYSCH